MKKIILFLTLLMISSCGVKSDPIRPDNSIYPRNYPAK